MARKVFYSFRYKFDNARVSQIKNMGVVEGTPTLSSNEWEKVEGQGDAGIQKWIDGQLKGKDCLVVLIGTHTAGRKWIKYEIKKAWDDGKGVLGIHIHNLKDLSEQQTTKGADPFAGFTIGSTKTPMSNIVKTYDPPYKISTNVYSHIKDNLASWVEEAIKIRAKY